MPEFGFEHADRIAQACDGHHVARCQAHFELGFEGINRSGRHKSGIAVRFPRMLRIRHDKPLHEANTLQDLEMLLNM